MHPVESPRATPPSGSGTATGDVHSFLHVETREQVLHHNGQDNLIHRLAPVFFQRRACIDGRRTATAAPHSFLYVRTRTLVQHHNRHVIRVQGLQLWNLHGLPHGLDHAPVIEPRPEQDRDLRCQSGPSAKDSVIFSGGDSSKNYGADQQRLQISDLHFDKFPTSTTFACWKTSFKTEICTCSQLATEAMQ